MIHIDPQVGCKCVNDPSHGEHIFINSKYVNIVLKIPLLMIKFSDL